MENFIISKITKNNWKKNNISSEWKLQQRANKTKSTKNIVPREYFYDVNLFKICKKYFEQWDSILDILGSIALNLSKNLNKQNILDELNSWEINTVIYEIYCYDLSQK